MKKILPILMMATMLSAHSFINLFDFLPKQESLPNPEFVIKTDKKIYDSGDLVEVTIDTKGKKGYIYLFTTFSDTFVVLFPNKFYNKSIQIQGKYHFTQDFPTLAEEFEYVATNDTRYYKEKTKLVAILSEKKLPINHEIDVFEIFTILKTHSQKAKKMVSLLKGMMVRAKRKKSGKIFSSYVDFDVLK